MRNSYLVENPGSYEHAKSQDDYPLVSVSHGTGYSVTWRAPQDAPSRGASPYEVLEAVCAWLSHLQGTNYGSQETQEALFQVAKAQKAVRLADKAYQAFLESSDYE